MSFRHFVSAIVVAGAAMTASAQLPIVKQLNLVSGTNGLGINIIPAAAGVQQNWTLPATAPTVGQALVATAVSGSNVTMQWQTPTASADLGSATGTLGVANGGTGATTAGGARQNLSVLPMVMLQKTAETPTGAPDHTVWVNDPHLVTPLLANKVYVLEAYLRMYEDAAGGPNMEIDFEVPAGTNMVYYTTELTASGVPEGGNYTEASTVGLNLAAATIKVYQIQGFIVTGGTAGNLQLRFRSTQAANEVTMAINSFAILTTKD